MLTWCDVAAEVAWAELDADGRRLAMLGVGWALSEEAAGLPHPDALELAIVVREAAQAGPAGEARAWRAAAQLVVIAAGLVAAKAGGPEDVPWAKLQPRTIHEEPLVLEAARMLAADRVVPRERPLRADP